MRRYIIICVLTPGYAYLHRVMRSHIEAYNGYIEVKYMRDKRFIILLLIIVTFSL